MTEKQKLEKLLELFNEMKELFPTNHISINVHDIDFTHLPDSVEWKIKPLTLRCLTAKLKDSNDITLFQN